MKIRQLSSSTIQSLLESRLKVTNGLFCLHQSSDSKDNVDSGNLIYFRYYFDFSTAIETTMRGIAFQEAKMCHNADYFLRIGQIDDTGKSFFLSREHAGLLLNDFKYEKVPFFDEMHFLEFAKRIECLKSCKSLFLTENEDLSALYDSVRTTRNKIAHGICETGVEYTKEHLRCFALVYFFLIEYYKIIELVEQSNHGDDLPNS